MNQKSPQPRRQTTSKLSEIAEGLKEFVATRLKRVTPGCCRDCSKPVGTSEKVKPGCCCGRGHTHAM